MKNAFDNREWEAKLKRFPAVWNRVESAGGAEPAPAAPLMPGKDCRSRAVRFNPHRRGCCC